MEIKQMNIYERLSAISIELSTVAKNLEVALGKSSYKAVGEADVLRSVKPLEHKYRVYSYPYSRTIIESGVLENEAVDYSTKEKIVKKNLYERMEVTYRFVNIDNPSEYVDITTYGDGIDPGDKSVGKAMTYADKYALLKAYKIVTGDDPDQNPSADLKGGEIKKTPLDARLLEEAQTLKMDLNKVAVYLKKKVEDLTNEDLKKCIARQKAALKEANKNVG